MFKQVYNNYIKNENEILEKTKKILEADRIIKTDYIHESNRGDWTDEVIRRFNRQKREIENRIRTKGY